MSGTYVGYEEEFYNIKYGPGDTRIFIRIENEDQIHATFRNYNRDDVYGEMESEYVATAEATWFLSGSFVYDP